MKQRDLLEQYSQVLGALAQERPLLLVIDDLQWVDVGSNNLLFHLGRRLKGSRILMVAPQPFFRPRGTPFSVLHRIRVLSLAGHSIDL